MALELAMRTFSNDKLLVEERRKHIVMHSSKVFTKRGFDQTNMRKVAEACGMSAGTLYHYFGSKEEILYSIINTATSDQAKYIEEYGESLKTVKPTDGLRRLIEELIKWHDSNQDITLFIYQETRCLPQTMRETIFASEERILAVFEEILVRGIEAGEFAIKEPKLMAHNIIVIGHSWAFRRWFLREHFTLEKYIKEQTDTILQAITTGCNHRKAELNTGALKLSRAFKGDSK